MPERQLQEASLIQHASHLFFRFCVPELMPFRLTRQFINLMSPLKETGLMSSVMVCALRAFRSRADLLTTTMDVFVKEPSFDWKVGGSPHFAALFQRAHD